MVLRIKTDNRQAYDTHFKYIKCLADLTENISINYKSRVLKCVLPKIDQKKNLIKLTLQSLKDEYSIVQLDQSYSYASTSWLPIKSYYLVFNMLLTIEYVIKVQENVFKISHSDCIGEFTRKLEMKEIEFSSPILNQVFDSKILNHTSTVGAGLSSSTPDINRYLMIMKWVAKYKNNEIKRKIKGGIRTAKGKVEYLKTLSGFKVSIFDFFYLMRIRANYKDFAFIEDVSHLETAQYFDSFYKFTMHFMKALIDLKNDLIKKRM